MTAIRTGQSGPAPYGYRNILGGWELVAEEQETIKLICKLADMKMSLRVIAGQLMEDGVPGPRKKGKPSRTWTHEHVNKILKRARNGGTPAAVKQSAPSVIDGFALLLPKDHSIVEFGPDWVACDSCCYDGGQPPLRVTRDPKAAGWHKSGVGEWECEPCWREGATHINMEFTKDGCVVCTGYGNEYPHKKFTRKQVEDRIKKLDKKSLEYKFWNERLKDIGHKSSSRLMGCGLDKKYLELVRELVGFKGFGPLPEVIKV